MIPEVGSTCYFTFTAKFATLDGVYRVRSDVMFRDALLLGVNFVDTLYTPAGLQQSDFNTDAASYQNDRVAVIESVKDSSVVYNVPETILATVPDPTIREFLDMILVVKLGVQENNQVVYPLIDQIKDLIQSTLGSTDPLRIIANPENKIYLTDLQYEQLEAARAQNRKQLVPISVQLKQEIDKNTYLAAKVAAYEALIAQISNNQQASH